MAKEFLQKHFIKDVKGSLYRGKGSTAARLQNKTFTENGIFKADKGYDGFGEVGVDVPAPNIQPLTVTENGTYAAPDGVDGYSPVSVEIESEGGTDERFKQLVEGTITEVSDDTVTSVGGSAFYGCSKLTSVDLPSVTSVGSSAFYGCSKLSCVIFRAETVCALSHTNAFSNTPFASDKAGGTLLIPRALVEECKVATNWSSILSQNTKNRFLALEDYTVDGTITGVIDWDKLNNTQGG